MPGAQATPEAEIPAPASTLKKKPLGRHRRTATYGGEVSPLTPIESVFGHRHVKCLLSLEYFAFAEGSCARGPGDGAQAPEKQAGEGGIG